MDYPGKYYGLKISAGQNYQQYVSLKVRTKNKQGKIVYRRANRDEILEITKRAKRIEKRLKHLQKLDKERRNFERLTNPVRRHQSLKMTRVKGITLELKTTKRKLKAYTYPCFIVYIAEHQPKAFYISKLGYKNAWSEAVRFLAKLKKIKTTDHLISRIPPKVQLNKLFERMKHETAKS